MHSAPGSQSEISFFLRLQLKKAFAERPIWSVHVKWLWFVAHAYYVFKSGFSYLFWSGTSVFGSHDTRRYLFVCLWLHGIPPWKAMASTTNYKGIGSNGQFASLQIMARKRNAWILWCNHKWYVVFCDRLKTWQYWKTDSNTRPFHSESTGSING